MCGITGYNIKNSNALHFVLSSLEALEYRGYDSAGVSYIDDNKICTQKVAGRIIDLYALFPEIPYANIAIGHTRWSTHGKPTTENAHPHHVGKVSLVHNGIIENYQEIKKELQNLGCEFHSTTDTETIVHFINRELQKYNVHIVIQNVLKKFKGKYAVAFLIEGDDNIYAFRSSGSPLVVGVLENGYTIASDFNTISQHTNKFIILEDWQYTIFNDNNITFFNSSGEKVEKNTIVKNIQQASLTKNNFKTFMMKEIHEQPDVVQNLLSYYVMNNTVNLQIGDIKQYHNIIIVACGTSYYSGLMGKYLIESQLKIPVSVEISSEFAHRTRPFLDKTLYIFASQSGETADTVAALEHTISNKTPCSKILSILNNAQSSMAQKSDFILECLAGPEIGVASTKNFIAQLVLFYFISSQNNQVSLEILNEIQKIPEAIKNILQNDNIKQSILNVSNKIIGAKKIVYTGRTLLFPIACEGALKLSELSYLLVQPIASGEFKHGPIAIVDSDTIAISLTHSQNMYNKSLLSNEEILSRDGIVITISDNEESEISIPEARDFKYTYPLLITVAVQLLSYYTAEKLGNDIDKPRNLAKSVTVE